MAIPFGNSDQGFREPISHTVDSRGLEEERLLLTCSSPGPAHPAGLNEGGFVTRGGAPL